MAHDAGAHFRYRPSDGAVERPPDAVGGAVYRVVGTADGVTLLRVTDPEGRRRYPGELVRLAPETLRASFEPTENPDEGLALRHRCRTMVSGAYWSVRRFLP